jgi:hypothetical protein
MTISEAWPDFGSTFTVAELDRMPDDGHRYELLDGALIVSPRPTTVHQVVATRLASALERDCPEGLCVVVEPAVQLDDCTEFDPDLVVVPLDEVGDAKFTRPPLPGQHLGRIRVHPVGTRAFEFLAAIAAGLQADTERASPPRREQVPDAIANDHRVPRFHVEQATGRSPAAGPARTARHSSRSAGESATPTGRSRSR